MPLANTIPAIDVGCVSLFFVFTPSLLSDPHQCADSASTLIFASDLQLSVFLEQSSYYLQARGQFTVGLKSLRNRTALVTILDTLNSYWAGILCNYQQEH